MAGVLDFAFCVCLVSFLPRVGTTTCSSGPQDRDTESETLSRVGKILDLSRWLLWGFPWGREEGV